MTAPQHMGRYRYSQENQVGVPRPRLSVLWGDRAGVWPAAIRSLDVASRAWLDPLLTLAEMAERCSAGQARAAVPSWSVAVNCKSARAWTLAPTLNYLMWQVASPRFSKYCWW